MNYKTAGVLSDPKPYLSPFIWNMDLTIKREVKDFILKKAYGKFGDLIGYIFVLGSITGYKWDPDSDVDVFLALKEITGEDKTHGAKDISGCLAPNSLHQINFYIGLLSDTTKASYAKSDFGVYSLLDDT